MKIPLNWVRDFTQVNIKTEKLCELLSLKLSEVESYKTSKSGDVVIEIENKALTHRGDCFSIEGIAREISAITGNPLKLPSYILSGISSSSSNIHIDVENTIDCPRYTAVKIKGIRVKPSPKEIKTRLADCGIRPINNIVDFTNYVMVETGQPLHAFDANKLGNKGGKYAIGVRRAKNGEYLETLDNATRELSKDNIIITNNDKPIAVAGIIGGKSAEVDKNTTEIILEAATFNNFVTRKSSRKLGVRTEASLRFEKNLDPNLTARGVGKFISLIQKYNAGEVEYISDFYLRKKKPLTINTTLQFLNESLGITLGKENILDIFSALTFRASAKGDNLKIVIPTFRRDISIKEDLVEELARIYGYEKITPKLPKKSLAPTILHPKLLFIRKVKEMLKVLGYSEVYCYSFIGEDAYKKLGMGAANLLEIINPLSPELKFMRDNLFPSMYEKAELNKNNFSEFKLFEIGKEIHKSKIENALPKEVYTLCVAYYDKDQMDYETLYRKAKGDLEVLLAAFTDSYIATTPKLPEPHLVMHKINLEELYKKYSTHKKKIKDTSPYPPVIENVSFYIKDSAKARIGDIIKRVKTIDSLITTVDLEDVYKTKGNKSVTLKIIYQNAKKSLSDSEVAPIRKKIIRLLEKELNLKVRK